MAAGSGVPHAYPKGVSASHAEQLFTTARLETPPPSTVFAVAVEASIVKNSGVSTVVVPHADRTHAPPDVAPRLGLSIFTSPFRANVDPSPLPASGAALAAARAPMPPHSPQRIPTRCAAATALALRRRKEDVCAQRQRRLCHEVRCRVYVKAHEARMRLLFGLTSANGDAAVAARLDALAQGCAATASAPPKAVHGMESIIAGAEAYLQSLDSSKSEEQAKVLRVISSMDTALLHQLASAYMHGPPLAFFYQVVYVPISTSTPLVFRQTTSMIASLRAGPRYWRRLSLMLPSASRPSQVSCSRINRRVCGGFSD
ncbi:hypothetical protein CUR178_05491 [Leishmania enriettii]|uniref:Uncharacterized protein n=1 Tax=Leishmania enriettii TaxID=5663 RepID=A0A836KQD5_LEIEN|nr:hypothetical protein CUR178_05491 [Leishmania enriettii]